MIKFRELRVKNFLSVGNNFLKWNLCDHRNTVILGQSGSGKSMLLDALSFVLFNKSYRDINKAQLVNSINKNNCIVEIEFFANNKKVRVKRGIKPNVFEIYLDDKLIDQDSHSRDYQSILEKQILQFDYVAFRQIVVLGSIGFTPFMQMTPMNRRAIVEELLGLQIFSSMNVILKERIKTVKAELVDLSYQQKLIDEKIKIYQEQEKEAQKDTQKKQNELLAAIKEHEAQIKTTAALIKKLEQNLSNVTHSIDAKKVAASKIKYSKVQDQLIRSKKTLEKEIAFYEKNDECPTCSQEIDLNFKKKEIETKTAKIKKIEDGLLKVDAALQKIKTDESIIQTTQNKIEKIKSDISKHKSTVSVKTALIDSSKVEIKKLKSVKKTSEKEKIQELKKELNQIKSTEEKTLSVKEVYSVAHDLLKDDGIKSQIIKNYLPVINKYLNKYLQEMNFYVRFSLDENFKESVQTLGYENFSYGNFSEGERQRIDLAILFTWRTIAQMKNSMNTNLLVMDEIFDSALDLTATENVVGLISSKLFNNLNIFVISHKSDIKDKFQNCIEVKKVNSFTQFQSK
jgi:DNA repair exonuclease SbcCD ATPase subunit